MKRTFALLIAILMLAPTLLVPGIISFADEEKVLFSSSFEDDEAPVSGANLASSGIKPAKYKVDGKGLPVLLTTVEGSVDYVGNENKFNLFDGRTETKFLTNDSYVYVSFSLMEPAKVSAYEIVSANDASERDPKSWTLYASKDGKDYKVYDEQKNVKFSKRYETIRFEISKPAEYQWFKIVVTENYGASMVQFSELVLYSSDMKDGTGDKTEDEAGEGMAVATGYGPMQTKNCRAGAWSGNRCLEAVGEQTEKEKTFARAAVYEGLNIPIAKNTVFSYYVFPGLFNVGQFDYVYTPCRVILDLHFTDGTCLSDLCVEDQHGSVLSPSGQAEGETLYTAQWNYIECEIGKAAGKTVDRVEVYFDMAETNKPVKFMTFFDDLKIENKDPTVYEHLSDYINILRGTNNDGSFSRGLCTPGVTMPNGFNFYTPVTDPEKATACYNYMVNGSNNPLDSISIMHIPSNWLSSYGTWQFMANTTVRASEDVTDAMISSAARRSKFTHENEIARAHYYSVTLNEDTPASGVRIEVTPTDHAAVVRFTFPKDAENASVIFDSLWGGGATKFEEDRKTFTGSSSHTAAGSSNMKVYGQFDIPYDTAATFGKKAIVTFPKGTTVVTMKIASSFLKGDQARHNLELEVGDKSFDEVYAEAQKAWDDLCGKFEIEGASYAQLVDFYSCLYRLYAYPMLYSENEGTNEEPVWVYASPYKNGRKTQGVLYTVNGFWDTYRTTWSAYSLFTENKDAEMLNGLVQHYIDSGWIPRWICPGGVDCMVGTSSDIIFADAYIKGIDFDYKHAWESMIENASAYSPNMGAGGRPKNNTTPFLGYVPNTTAQGYSSSMESYINDYGLYRMAEKMGLKDEAEYYLNRCLKYTDLFNDKLGFFMGKNERGVFSATAGYDPASWGGPKEDYTESVGWVNAFPAVFDGDGLAALYGGREALAEKLNKLFDDSPAAMRKVVYGLVHEADEFKEVKMGQYEHNNQPSHHLIYTYAFSSEPYKVQQYTREVLRHVYVGSELGQGYPGDEDNGEMSGWFIFNALGFYPYCLASGEYVIGSPLFDKVTVHLDNGNDLVITAHNNSKDNVFIQSMTVNGEAYDKLYLTHETLTKGAEIVFEMGDKPSSFGASEDARPSSLTSLGYTGIRRDLTDGASFEKEWTVDAKAEKDTVVYTNANKQKIFDGDLLTAEELDGDVVIVLAGSVPSKVDMITLSCDKRGDAPKSMKVEVSNDGENWRTVLEKDKIVYTFAKFVTPFALPVETRGNYLFCRLTLSGGQTLAEVEFIGTKGVKDQTDDPFTVDQKPTETPTPETQEPTGQPTPETQPTPDKPSENEPPEEAGVVKWLVPVILGGCALIAGVAAIAIIVAINAKKKKN